MFLPVTADILAILRAVSRKAKAAICREHNKPVVVEDIAVDRPKRGEAMVKLGACGVCHSDLSAITGTIALPLPLVLGHEGAGVVEEVGEGVSELAKGDHVVFSFIYMCGKCRFCVAGRPVLCLEQGKALTTPLEGTPRVRDAQAMPLNIFSGCGAMAEYATVSAENLIKIDAKVPLDCAALVGCGVTTGVGAVFNTAKVEPGSSVAVFGCGGVGLSVIQGARIAGAERIIAIDTLEAKLAMAKQFGATDTVLVKKDEDLAKGLKKLTSGGPDYAFECVGSGELAGAAYRAIRRGGLAVVVGVAKPSDSTSVRTMTLPFEEKTLTGSYFGSCVPRVDFPRMLSLYMAGRLKLEELITRRYSIAEAPSAFADLQAGKNARGVIVF
jgi:Zn-dependent alcohol dehydrogenase